MKQTDFAAIPNSTITIDATTSWVPANQRKALPTAGSQIRVTNIGSSRVYIEFGDATVVPTAITAGGATTGSLCILPISVAVFPREGMTHVGAISVVGSASIHFTPGEWL